MKRLFLLFLVIAIITCLVMVTVFTAAQVKPKPGEKQEATPAKPAPFAYEDKIGVVKIGPREPIHIACWMVVAGPDASLGTDTKRGVEIAIEDKGGRLLGHPIKLSVRDTGCNAEGGRAAAIALAADPTIVVAIGPSCSIEARSGVPILWNMGIPTISPSSTAPFLTDPNRGSEYEGFLRTSHNDKIQGIVAAEFAIKRLGAKRAATINDGSPYSTQLQAVFSEMFKKQGGTITSQESVAPTDRDMRPLLTKIAVGKPDIIYFPIFIAAGTHITRQAKEVKGLEKTALMSADGTFSPDFLRAAGDAAVGMYHSSPDFSTYTAAYKDFLTKHQRKYGGVPLAPFHAHAYDAAMMIFDAIPMVASSGPNDTLYIDRRELRNALYATKGLNGLTGVISCDQYGDCGYPRIALYQTTIENVRKSIPPDKPIWKPN